MKRALLHPVETFRTAPLQFTGLAINVKCTALIAATEATDGAIVPSSTGER